MGSLAGSRLCSVQDLHTRGGSSSHLWPDGHLLGLLLAALDVTICTGRRDMPWQEWGLLAVPSAEVSGVHLRPGGGDALLLCAPVLISLWSVDVASLFSLLVFHSVSSGCVNKEGFVIKQP